MAAMTRSHNIGVSVLMLLALISRSQAINCYYCNSANNSACLDVDLYEEELRARLIPVVNCEASIISPHPVNFFCRKIQQTIFFPRREPELRVTRGCGWVEHERPCYKADNADHLETVCQCFHDHCNGASSTRPFWISTLTTLCGYLVFRI